MSAPTHSVRVTHGPDGVSGVVLYEAVDAAGAPIPGPRAAVLARTHGNEPLGDPVLERIAEVVDADLIAGSVLAIRANERAASLGLRHTDEGSDLNRMWDPQQLARIHAMAPEARTYEEQRVVELAPLLVTCDAILDLHSTSRPSAPFLVFRDDQAHAALALKLGVEHLVTGVHDNGVLSGGMAANIGLHQGEKGSRIGVVFEAGQHTDPRNGDRAWKVAHRFLAALGTFAERLPPTKVRAKIYETTERFVQSSSGNEQYRFVGYEGGEPGGGRRGLPMRKLHSFEDLQADEVILRRGRNEVVRADNPFAMLMPAPTTPPGTDLYYVAQRRHGGLTFGVQRTDEEARREAVAIERMLDLVTSDELERGTTWAAFDTRRLYDLCATIIGHQLRLSPDDPHRRLTIMGRGDTGIDENDRRSGARYRQAMRTAIAEGLPIERIQLLRGAPIAWLDTLTSHGMLDLIERRRKAAGTDSGIRMRVSLRQPHTASLLVGGDLDLAQRTGDTRSVRVLLLVEAASVEPDGQSARVKVVRTGLLSNRPEVLAAASNLLHSLRSEHGYHVRQGVLRNEAAVQSLTLDDDAIEAVADPHRMEALRASLHRAQLRLWCDALRLEVTEPVRLAREEDVGHWLARTMATTGILDADALSALLVRRDGAGWIVDPETVDRLYEKVSVPADAQIATVLSTTAAATPHAPTIHQPTFARDVTADDLERWVGWTRFVRGVMSVPDTRGKDLDLAFSGKDIRDTLVRWFDGARALAAQRHGDVMVVVAGDGLNPSRDHMAEAFPLYRSHRGVVLDPHLHYLRIQHAQGTHLAWMKDFVSALESRPSDSPSTALQFEVEHGATVSVVMVLERDHGAMADPRPWSLDGWEATCCGVILSDLEAIGGDDYKVGMFTERMLGRPERVCHELLHFGRAHCEGLMIQAGSRLRADTGPLAPTDLHQTLVAQIARWIEHVRLWRHTSGSAPRDPEARAQWVSRRLGLADARLSRALAREMDGDRPAEVAAQELWASVQPWPGPMWHARADHA
ncbi:MAG: succinylglutamate desuccinylase/aspartoacylase family protein [Myxococcales bacterium]|nr:succinylglutamate desuccinylase/aspartoacylase family protein [Myxococcales bacterium]